MIRKYPIFSGAFIGLAIGVVAFVAGLELQADSGLLCLISVVESPLLPLILWMHQGSQGWGTTADLYRFLALILFYWACIGSLIGLGVDLVRSWRGRKTRIL